MTSSAPGNSGECPRVTVMTRVRPLLAEERGAPLAVTLHTPDAVPGSKQFLSVSTPFHPTKSFQFHHVFAPTASNEEVFAVAGAPAVERIFGGHSHAIVCYGQTNTGKTYTWRSLLQNVSEELFDHLRTAQSADSSGSKWSVSVSALQLYNDVVTDLLVAPPPPPPQNATPDDEAAVAAMLAEQKLTIRDDVTTGGFVVKGLTHAQVSSAAELATVVEVANENRVVALTGMNVQSSRSHVFVTIRVLRRAAHGSTTEGRLLLADLAGTERLGRTNATGVRKNEAQSINASLTALGNVVHALADPVNAKNPRHVPFRDSRLTKLLHEFMARPGARTAFILTVSPTRADAGETTSVLQFGQRAMHIPQQQQQHQQQQLLHSVAGGSAGSSRTASPSASTRKLHSQTGERAACESLMSALEAAQDLVGTLEARVAQLEAQLSRSEGRIEDQESEITELRAVVASREGDVRKERAAADAAKAAAARDRECVEDLQSRLAAHVRDNEYLNGRVEALHAELADVQRQCESFRRSFDEERASKADLLHALRTEEQIPIQFLTVESIAAFVRKEISAAAANNAALEQQLSTLRAHVEAAERDSEREIAWLRAELQQRDAKVDRMSKRYDALVEERQAASVADANVVDEVREERDRLRRELRDMARSLSSLADDKAKLESELHAAEAKATAMVAATAAKPSFAAEDAPASSTAANRHVDPVAGGVAQRSGGGMGYGARQLSTTGPVGSLAALKSAVPATVAPPTPENAAAMDLLCSILKPQAAQAPTKQAPPALGSRDRNVSFAPSVILERLE